MPWHDNSNNGSDKNDGNRGPWGQPPRNGGSNGGSNGGGGRRPTGSGGEPPDIEDLLEASRQRLKRAFPGGGRGSGGGNFRITRGMVGIGALVLAGLFFYAGLFQVEPDQQAVRTTFGKYAGISGSGLKWHVPFAQNYHLVTVSGKKTENIGTNSENLILTSDRNIVDISFTVDWVASPLPPKDGELPNAAKMIFNIENPGGTVKAVAEAAMREVIGSRELIPIITSGQTLIQQQTRERIQEVLDEYDSGIEILLVSMETPKEPSAVREAFADFNQAGNQKKSIINNAELDANKIIPVAEGEALKKIQDALGYASKVEADALGQVERFNQIYTEYQKQPEITRQRLYLETTEKFLGKMDKIIIDDDAGSGVVPYLPLPELGKNKQANQ